MLGIDLAHPGRLWLLVALVPAAAWAARGAAMRLREWGALGQSGRPPGDGATGRLLAMTLLVIALAQPRWGRSATPEAREGHDVVLCFDASRSMGAEDAVPDRLAVAIEAGSSLARAMAEEPGLRSAVVAFAGRAVVRCPLTSELDAAVDAIRGLRPGEVEPGGTDLGAALDAAAGAFDVGDPPQGRTVVVFSDGEDHAGSWPSALGRLRAGGIIVHSVAIGDPDRGHPVPGTGRKSPAMTRRSDSALGAIARGTGGALIPIGLTSVDLGSLYRDRIAPIARRRRDEIDPPERTERFGGFVLAALALGLVGGRPGRGHRSRSRLAAAIPAMVALAIGAGPWGGSPGGLVESGRASYNSGRFVEALGDFEEAIAIRPAAAIPRYDAASALFRLGRYREAIARYEEARDRGDPGLATKSEYALGNAHLALGDVPGALAHYDACLASTWPGPEFDAVRRDAAENRAYAAGRVPPPDRDPGPGGREGARADRPRPDRGGAREKGPALTSPAGAIPPDPGGAGGMPSAPGGGRSDEPRGGRPPGGSAEARLDAALREIREARRPRPSDAPPAAADGPSKDW